MPLTIVPASGELLDLWRTVHNIVIPPLRLTTEEVAQRALRNDLTVAFQTASLSVTRRFGNRRTERSPSSSASFLSAAATAMAGGTSTRC